MSFFKVLTVLFAGTAAGFINTLAGGGSLIAMSALIFMGLPSAVANGTNRIGILIQSTVATTNFHQKGFSNFKFSFKLSIPAIIGAVIGSNLAVDLPEAIFNRILAGIMILIVILIIIDPKEKMEATVEKLSSGRQLAAMVAFFFVGVYGGFIQGGVGLLFIVTLSLITGLSLVQVNSIKVFVIAAYTIPSLTVFIINGKVVWLAGFILAAGNSFGAYLGSNFAVSKGDKWIKIVLAAVILVMAVKLLIGS